MAKTHVGQYLMFALALLIASPLQADTTKGSLDLKARLSLHSAPQVYRAEVIATSEAVETPRLDSLPAAKKWQPGDPIRFVPKRVYPLPPLGDPVNPTTWTVDPLMEIQAEAEAKAAPNRNFGTQDVNVAGQGFSGVFPPDTVGDVGPNHYIQAINDGTVGTTVQIYNKTGATIGAAISLSGLGGTGLCATGAGDPIILYDELADRWVLTEFSGAGNALCVYISTTPDPTGTYFSYTFGTPDFPDYPKYGVWPDAYYVGTNEGGGSPVYAMNRTAMLTGAAATMQRFTAPDLGGFGFQVLPAADLDGPAPPVGTPGIFVRHRDDEVHNPGANNPGQDFLEIWELDVDFAVPANSSFTGPTNIAIAEIDSDLCGLSSFFCFPQPNGQQLDPLREVIMHRPGYRNFGSHQTLLVNLTTDVNGNDRGGIRWVELRNTGGGWTVFQEGTYSPDTDNRWMGSIAMSGNGDIALGYSVVSTTQPSDIRYTGRVSGDTAGTMPQGEHVIGAGGSSQNAERWGDYSAMSVDPSDDCTFWYTNEYVPSGNQWATRIASFNFPGCGGPPPVCGDGMIEGPEVCDDGNMNGGDGCSAVCQVEAGFTCVGEPSVCTPDPVGDCFAEDFENGLAGWTLFNTGALDLDWGTTDDGFCWDGSTQLPPPPAANVTGGTGEAACIDSDAAGLGQVRAYLCSPQFNTGMGDTIELITKVNYQIFDVPDAGDLLQWHIGFVAPSPGTIGGYIPVTPPLTDNFGTFGALPGGTYTITGLEGFPDTDIYLCIEYQGDFDWYAQVDEVTLDASEGCGGQVMDTDQDGVPDDQDNCVTLANPTQLDTNGDGFGNRCDADLNGDCVVNGIDLGLFKQQFFAAGPNNADFNGDNSVNAIDLGLLRTLFFMPPGPNSTGTCP